jgi:hypothetical protein
VLNDSRVTTNSGQSELATVDERGRRRLLVGDVFFIFTRTPSALPSKSTSVLFQKIDQNTPIGRASGTAFRPQPRTTLREDFRSPMNPPETTAKATANFAPFLRNRAEISGVGRTQDFSRPAYISC